MTAYIPMDFPVHALPPIIRDAVLEVHRNTQAPLGMIASSALAASSIALQGLAKVKRLEGLEGPISLWFTTIADSGERKTAIDSKFLGVIREFEAEQAVRYAKEMVAYEAAIAGWRAEEKAILNAIKKGAIQS